MNCIKRMVIILCSTMFFYIPQRVSENTPQYNDEKRAEIWESVFTSEYEQVLANALYQGYTGDDSVFECDGVWPYAMEQLSVIIELLYDKPQSYPLYIASDVYEASYLDEADYLPGYKKYSTLAEVSEIAEVVPIGYDALVLMTSMDNPVSSLSTEELRNIYTGVIRNWSMLSDEDIPICAYQRPNSEYAQNVMQCMVMKGLPMAAPPVQYVLPDEGSEDAVPMVLGYDNAAGSIGYTMYRHFNGRYNADKTRLLQVDGVTPNESTIRSGQYPYRVTCYAIFPKATPADHPIRSLVAWMQGDEGQRIISRVGLIPLQQKNETTKTMDVDASNNVRSLGTATKLSTIQDVTLPYAANMSDYQLLHPGGIHMTCYKELIVEKESVKDEITKWLIQAEYKLRNADIAAKYVQDKIITYFFYYKNLISVHMSLGVGYDTLISTAVFDSDTGKQLSLSDLFFPEVDYMDYIN